MSQSGLVDESQLNEDGTVNNLLDYYKIDVNSPDEILSSVDKIRLLKMNASATPLNKQDREGNTLLHVLMIVIIKLNHIGTSQEYENYDDYKHFRNNLMKLVDEIIKLPKQRRLIQEHALNIGLNLKNNYVSVSEEDGDSYLMGATPLYYSLFLHQEVVERTASSIIDCGTEINVGLNLTMDGSTQTVLQYLCAEFRDGNEAVLNIINKILDDNMEYQEGDATGLNLSYADRDQKTALVYICEIEFESQVLVLNKFLKYTAEDLGLNKQDVYGNTALITLCKSLMYNNNILGYDGIREVLNTFIEKYSGEELGLNKKDKLPVEEEDEEYEEGQVEADGNTALIYLCMIKDERIEPYILKFLEKFTVEEMDLSYKNAPYGGEPISALIAAQNNNHMRAVEKINQMLSGKDTTLKRVDVDTINYYCMKQTNKYIQTYLDIGDHPIMTDEENREFNTIQMTRGKMLLDMPEPNYALPTLFNILFMNHDVMYKDLIYDHIKVNIKSSRGIDYGGVKREFNTYVGNQYEAMINDNTDEYDIRKYDKYIDRGSLLLNMDELYKNEHLYKRLNTFLLYYIWRNNTINYRLNISLRDIIKIFMSIPGAGFEDPTILMDEPFYKYVGAAIFGIQLDKERSGEKEEKEERKEEVLIQEEKEETGAGAGAGTGAQTGGSVEYTKENKVTIEEILDDKEKSLILLWMFATYYDTKENIIVKSFEQDYNNTGGSFYFNPDEDGDYVIIDQIKEWKVSNQAKKLDFLQLYSDCIHNLKEPSSYLKNRKDTGIEWKNMMYVPLLTFYRILNKEQQITDEIIEEFINNQLVINLKTVNPEYGRLEDIILSILRNYKKGISEELLKELEMKYPTQGDFFKDLLQFWSGSRRLDEKQKYTIDSKVLDEKQTFVSHTCFFGFDVNTGYMKDLNKDDVLLALTSSFGGEMTLAGGGRRSVGMANRDMERRTRGTRKGTRRRTKKSKRTRGTKRK